MSESTVGGRVAGFEGDEKEECVKGYGSGETSPMESVCDETSKRNCFLWFFDLVGLEETSLSRLMSSRGCPVLLWK